MIAYILDSAKDLKPYVPGRRKAKKNPHQKNNSDIGRFL